MPTGRMAWVWVAWMALAGCGSGGGDGGGGAVAQSTDNNNHGYGFQYDVRGSTGLLLRYAPTLVADFPPFTEADYYESAFADTEHCTGLTAPAPFVIWDHLSGVGVLGLYYSRPSLVVIAAPLSLRHEFVHYLLDFNTGDADGGHRSRFFTECI